MVCECDTSAYLYVPVGHVTTGDLRDIHVRQLLVL